MSCDLCGSALKADDVKECKRCSLRHCASCRENVGEHCSSCGTPLTDNPSCRIGSGGCGQ